MFPFYWNLPRCSHASSMLFAAFFCISTFLLPQVLSSSLKKLSSIRCHVGSFKLNRSSAVFFCKQIHAKKVLVNSLKFTITRKKCPSVDKQIIFLNDIQDFSDYVSPHIPFLCFLLIDMTSSKRFHSGFPLLSPLLLI